MNKGLIIFIFGLIFQTGFSQTTIEKDFKKHFDKYDVNGCFVLFIQSDNEYLIYNSNLCDTGYIPASTFKIPHSLIALEENVVRDSNQIIKWDGYEWPNNSCNQDQTLKTAIEHSCVWVFTGFAEQISIDSYCSYVNSFDYGNKNLTGAPTCFWLSGQFRISANQQIIFLRKFYNYDLPISKQSIDMVKDMIILEQTDSYILSGKTGGGVLANNEFIMWLVGYIEKNGQAYFFAMNFKTDDFNKTKQARYEITKDILRELKLME